MSDSIHTASRRPVAYKDLQFLDSDDGRAIRILSEYLHPLAHFRDQKIQDTIVFFGSARIGEEGPLGRYYREARELARVVTEWSEHLGENGRRFVVCTGGGPGIMEAANRGASDAGGKSIGMNIGLPFEQWPNPYITPGLSFEFKYFFMRKFWLAYPARALVVFPGGFGTLDETFELLTLMQTQKIESKVVLVLYGTEYWKRILNFEALVEYGTISPEDLTLFHHADDPQVALDILKEKLTEYYLQPEVPAPAPEGQTPSLPKSRI